MTLLPRFRRYTDSMEAAAAVARAVEESGEALPATATTATAPGDTRRLRGIPVVGGASGTQPGTDPVAALLRKERHGK